MLDKIVAERWFTASAAFGFWPAQRAGRRHRRLSPTRAAATPIATLHTLRQQLSRREGRANAALADFVAPRGSGLADYIGAFAVTAGIGEDAVAERFKRANDDYSAIMVKALADRLAEAFAERLHQRVRREFWGYAADEAFRADELIAEKYRGIRPAPGYPAQPDHTEKGTLFHLLEARAHRHQADRELRHDAGRRGVRALFQPSAEPLFRRRQDRTRPGRGLRQAQRLEPCRSASDGWRRSSITSARAPSIVAA